MAPSVRDHPEPLHIALLTIDATATPSVPIARELHAAVRSLSAAESDMTTADLVARLGPVHRALTTLEGLDLSGLSARHILELLVRMDDALDLLEAPDLGRVPLGELPERFRALYSAIVRLRTTYLRLRAAWHRREEATP